MITDPAIQQQDEATSNIDTRTELQVQTAFNEMIAGRTSLLVAHRLSTIREADCILVLKDGRLIERDRKSTRLNSSHSGESRMPSSA